MSMKYLLLAAALSAPECMHVEENPYIDPETAWVYVPPCDMAALEWSGPLLSQLQVELEPPGDFRVMSKGGRHVVIINGQPDAWSRVYVGVAQTGKRYLFPNRVLAGDGTFLCPSDQSLGGECVREVAP